MHKCKKIICIMYKRTPEDALEVIGHAKHTQDEVYSITQTFSYPSAEETLIASQNIKLIDVDENFIKKIEDGERFVIRGEDDEKIVMCSENETFEMKEGEISNALVFVPDLLLLDDVKKDDTTSHKVNKKDILGILNSYLELRPTFPRLNKLRQILCRAVYKGPEEEDDTANCGYYLCDLLNVIQSSRTELVQGLKDLGACCVEGRWRLLHIEYESRVVSLLINLAEENSWETIPKFEATALLTSVMPDFIIEHIFENYTTPCPNEDETSDSRQWNCNKLCRIFGEMLLRAGEGKFRYNEFMMAWKECLPKVVVPDLSSLRGLALMEQEGTQQQVIHLFPEYDLPENISERFRLLFKRKEKWSLAEIEPYIEKLTTKDINVSKLLTKFSRPSTINGIRVFGARHLK